MTLCGVDRPENTDDWISGKHGLFNRPEVPVLCQFLMVQGDDMGARSTVTVYCMPAFEVAETSAAKMGGNSGGQEGIPVYDFSQHVHFLIV